MFNFSNIYLIILVRIATVFIILSILGVSLIRTIENKKNKPYKVLKQFPYRKSQLTLCLLGVATIIYFLYTYYPFSNLLIIIDNGILLIIFVLIGLILELMVKYTVTDKGIMLKRPFFIPSTILAWSDIKTYDFSDEKVCIKYIHKGVIKNITLAYLSQDESKCLCELLNTSPNNQ